MKHKTTPSWKHELYGVVGAGALMMVGIGAMLALYLQGGSNRAD